MLFRSYAKRSDGGCRRKPPHAQAEDTKRYAAPSGPGSIQGSCLLASAGPLQMLCFLALALMFFNQGGTCAEDRGESQEQACRRRTVALRNSAGHSRRQAAKSEADGMRVPSALFECRPFNADNHYQANSVYLRPKATANQPINASAVALSAVIRNRINSLADQEAVGGKCHRTDDHRSPFNRGVLAALFQECEAERCQGNGRRCAEETSEAFWKAISAQYLGS